MVHYPTLRPDPADDFQFKKTSDAGRWLDQTTYPVTQLRRTFAAHGVGIGAGDLALDLILNDLIERACAATGASGGAIALRREDEMVCRAACGKNVPDLGVGLDAQSGLSGACLQTREPQLCGDTVVDPRVDTEACRHLGIRSILVVPVLDGEELIGILEVVSPHLEAFGEFEVHTLEALAAQIAENRRRAHEPPPVVATEPAPSEVEPSLQAPSEPGLRSGVTKYSSKAKDSWTALLGALIISAAVLLGGLIGLRLGWRRAVVGHQRFPSHAVAAKAKSIIPAAIASEKQPGGAAPSAAPPETKAGTQQSIGAAVEVPAGPPPGGLIIYEKGKVIYRTPPSELQQNSNARVADGVAARGENRAASVLVSPASTSSAVQISEELAEALLVHRVEPLYPVNALQQKLQGPVVLEVQINREGKVRNLAVLSGNPQLVEAAALAVRQWRFQPYIINGQVVEMQTRITMNFAPPQ